MRYLGVCLVAWATLPSAAASVPSVEQLLDHFATNADLYQRSFRVRLESSRIAVIRDQATDGGAQEQREHHAVVCSWDGQRLREQRYSWGDFATGHVDREQARYESVLSDGDKYIMYIRSTGAFKEDLVSYFARPLPEGEAHRMVVADTGNWAWGYFAGQEGGRLDEFLRHAQKALVRPQMEVANGANCHVLEAETRTGRYTLWLDPNQGYNLAKLHYQGSGTDMVVSNTAFARFAEAWVPIRMQWEVGLASSGNLDVRYHQEIAVTEFEIDPNHEARRAFAIDDVPEGTEALFLASNGQRVPGAFVWRAGKPMPCLDEETLDYLTRVGRELAGRAAAGSTGNSAPGRRRDERRIPRTGTGPRQPPRSGMPAAPDSKADDTSGIEDGTPSLRAAPAKGTTQTPHCGLYCIFLVMTATGQERAFSDLVRPEYLDAPNGSTLSGLKKAAEDGGLHAEIVCAVSPRVLRMYPHSMILHVKGTPTSRSYDHYLLLLGVDGPRAWVLDPPGPVRSISMAELAARWDRKGLVLSSQPIESTGLIWRERARLSLIAGAVVLVLLLANRLAPRVRWSEMIPAASGRLAGSALQAAGLLLTSLLIGLAFHAVTQGGFLAYPDGMTATQQAHASDFIPRIELDIARQLHEQGVTFVDARQKRDFDAGHVKGAISIPVDANDAARSHAIRELSPGDPIVVYCQSVNCSFADIVAGRLRLDGFFRTSILPGGWVEWTTGIRQRAAKPATKPGSGKWRLNKDGTASPV